MPGEFERLIQVGIVTVVDPAAHKVRVKFPATGLLSDWLSVLKNALAISADQHDGSESSARASFWIPSVNDTVLVVYLPAFNSEGFVIGGI